MASNKKKAAGKKHIEPSDAIKNHLQERPSKKKPEYLVRGALLHCRCGSYARRLNLSKDHAIYMTEHPVIHELNCICGEGENITPFGVCKSTRPPDTELITCAKDVPRGPNGEPIGPAPTGVDIGRKCSPVIVDLRWTNTYPKTRIVDNGEHSPSDRALANSIMGAAIGEAAVTTVSFLVCKYGGIIEPFTSGQEYMDETSFPADYEKLMAEEFGFSEEECDLIKEAYIALITSPQYRNLTQREKIFQLFSNAAALNKDYSSASFAFRVAGMPTQSDAKKFFDDLGISSERLAEILKNQHDNAGNLNKADFSHEMAIWAVMASDYWLKSGANIIENFNLLASAKGDIYTASFGIDDKKADVDAENIYDRMTNSSEDLFSTILNYIRDKQANNINPQVEYISRYGDGSVVEGWNYLVDEFSKMGMGSTYLASDDPSYKDSRIPGPIKFIISLFREGMYVNAMIENGVALQGEETWNAVKELGPQTVSSDRQNEVAETMSEFLDYLYEEGDLAQYGIKYPTP